MNLLLDIGNTQTHAALATDRAIRKQTRFDTADWKQRQLPHQLSDLITPKILNATLCSVVPAAAKSAVQKLQRKLNISVRQLNHENCGVPVDYPNPSSIGADRLANARAGIEEFGAPLVVIDFGTAVTFDIINPNGQYTGGIIAPGLSAMTDYLHEKTALLPRITLRDPGAAIGRSTVQAMQIGAVHGYRGLIQALMKEVKSSLNVRRLPVVATGGHARLLAKQVPEIGAVRSLLTLDGLRLASAGWNCDAPAHDE
ncbi:MAG TPA: type III pantothenate kinase [Verrucomicrobiales bacterium]|nr:type III pantothenate kinase [Verrucomicrobiales bacterium]